MPRAAVVARPSVVALTALRPSSAPKIVAPTETRRQSSRRRPVRLCTCTACSARRTRSCSVVDLRRVLLAHLRRARRRGPRAPRVAAGCGSRAPIRRRRDDLRARALEELDRLRLRRPIGEVLLPGRVVLRLRGGAARARTSRRPAAPSSRSSTVKSASSARSQSTATAPSVIGVTTATSRVSSRPSFASE